MGGLADCDVRVHSRGDPVGAAEAVGLATGYYNATLGLNTSEPTLVARGCTDPLLGADLPYALEVPASYRRVSPLAALRHRLVNASGGDEALADRALCELMVDHAGVNASHDCGSVSASVYVPSGSLVMHFRAFAWRWVMAEADAHQFLSFGTAALRCASPQVCGDTCSVCASVGNASAAQLSRALLDALASTLLAKREQRELVWQDGSQGVWSSVVSRAAWLLRFEPDQIYEAVLAHSAAQLEFDHASRAEEVASAVQELGEFSARNESDGELFRRLAHAVASTLDRNSSVDVAPVFGCTDPQSRNHDPRATIDNNLCERGRRLTQLAREGPMEQYAQDAIGLENDAVLQQMRAITHVACDKAVSEPTVALRLRTRAAMLWPLLNKAQSSSGCCECNREGDPFQDCELWFRSGVGLHGTRRAGEYRKRLRRLRAEEHQKELREAIFENFDRACCVRPRDSTNGSGVKCNRRHCTRVFRERGVQRQGHVLRRLKQKDHPHLKDMGPDVSIGIDFVSPHDHSIPECRHREPGRPRDPGTQAADAECAARSAIHHISRKHGVDPEAITEMTTKLNIDLGKSMYRAAQMFGATKEGSDRSREEVRVKTADEAEERRRKELKERWALMTIEERAEHVAREAVRHKPREQHEKLEHAMRERKRRRKLERSEAVASRPHLMAAWHAAGVWAQAGTQSVTQLAGHAASHMAYTSNWTHSAASFAAGLTRVGHRKTLRQQLQLLRKHRVGHDVTMDNLRSHLGVGRAALAQMTPSHLQAMASMLAAEPYSAARHLALTGRALDKMVDKSSAFAEQAVEAHRRHRRLQEADGMQEAIDALLSDEERAQRSERARVVRRLYTELERLQALERARNNATLRGRRASSSFRSFGHKTKNRAVETPTIGGRRLLKTGGPAEFPKWCAFSYSNIAHSSTHAFLHTFHRLFLCTGTPTATGGSPARSTGAFGTRKRSASRARTPCACTGGAPGPRATSRRARSPATGCWTCACRRPCWAARCGSSGCGSRTARRIGKTTRGAGACSSARSGSPTRSTRAASCGRWSTTRRAGRSSTPAPTAWCGFSRAATIAPARAGWPSTPRSRPRSTCRAWRARPSRRPASPPASSSRPSARPPTRTPWRARARSR